jgi:cellulose synthase (UDP-forming)
MTFSPALSEGVERRRPPSVAVLGPGRRGFWARHERLVQCVATVALLWGGAYFLWRIGWSGRGVNPALFAVLLVAELFGWLSLVLYAFLGWRGPRSGRPPRRGTPTVDVFVCTYNEPVYVLEATLAGCRAITYPHTTYLLDDGRRAEMAELATRMDAQWVTRPDNRHAKAGNVNHALGVTDGELILTLDADHVPRPDILDGTLGYFDDSHVALVQTPHDFFNRDSFQHTRSERHEQTLFYEVLAPGKDRHNAMFWCGSATIIRRDALVAVGGVLTDTVAEDFHTTIAIHARGWRTHFHAETLVQGLAPHDLAGFLLQRERWARGNLAVFRTRENPITCRGLRPLQRLSYLASLLQYFSGLQRLALLGLLSCTLVTGRLPMRATPLTLLTLWLPWALLAFCATVGLARGTLGPADSTHYGLMTMGINVRSALSLLGARKGRFEVTPKEGIDEGGLQVLRFLTLLTATGAVLLGAEVLRLLTWAGVAGLPPLHGLALAVSLVLGAWELFFIGRVLVPLVRRRQRRAHYRFPVEMRGKIVNTVVPISDLTTAGLAFASPVEWPVYTRTRLLTRLPDATGTLRDLTLDLEVRSSRFVEEAESWRVGCRFVGLDVRTRACLVDFCYVVQPTLALNGSLPAPADVAEALTGEATLE